MEHIMEFDSDKIRILALSREGIWLPFMEIDITEKIMAVYRVPLLLKAEYLGQESQSNDQVSPESFNLPIPQL